MNLSLSPELDLQDAVAPLTLMMPVDLQEGDAVDPEPMEDDGKPFGGA